MPRFERQRVPGLIFDARALDLANLPRVDCHLHTSWTDGKATSAESYAQAVRAGLEVILFSEHSRKTSTDWFPRFVDDVRALPAEPCRAYVGTEVKVETPDGQIDTLPAIVDLCDIVMASVHRFPDSAGEAIPFEAVKPGEAVEIEHALTWAVLANPDVDILGHMFGMSYRRFGQAPSPDRIRSLMARAAETGVAVEINTHYHPNPHQYLEWAREAGARVTFGSNAHTLDRIGHALRTLRGGGPHG